MSKIIKLQSENVKRIKAVTIEPNGNVVIVGGKNGVGKSSVLDSISYAIGGKSVQCEVPLRNGANVGYTIVETDDLIIKRTYTDGGGGTLRVSGKDGREYKTPQRILDAMVGTLAFDPLAFMRLKSKEQAETLRKLLGVDVSDIDEAAKNVYDSRTEINKQAKDLASQIKGLAYFEDAPEEEIKTADLMAELEVARHQNTENAKVRNGLESLNAALVRNNEKQAILFQKMEELRSQINDAGNEEITLRDRVIQIEQKIITLSDIDEAPIKEKMVSVDELNRRVRVNAARKRKQDELERLQKESDSATELLNKYANEKASRLASANLPVDGLYFDDGGVLFNGIPLTQCSQAEQLRISVAMGMAQGSDLRVMLIREGSLLDETSMSLLRDLSEQHDIQLWIEVVGEREDCSIIIEDGSVKTIENPEKKILKELNIYNSEKGKK